jgi:hypothetical protein
MIVKDNLAIGGVYAVVHLSSGKQYIGSTHSFIARYNGHVDALRTNKHSSKALQHDWDIDGEDAFAFKVIEYVDNAAERRNREQHWMYVRLAERGSNEYNTHKATAAYPNPFAKPKETPLKEEWKPGPYEQEIAGYVTVGKAAAMLSVSERQIRKMIAARDLVAVAVGDRQPIWLIDKDSVMPRIDSPRKRRGPAKGHGGRPKGTTGTPKRKKSAAPSAGGADGSTG